MAFPETELRAVDVDRARFSHVDLRGAIELDLRSCSGLEGCLLGSHQVHELAFVLAMAAGVSLEVDEEG